MIGFLRDGGCWWDSYTFINPPCRLHYWCRLYKYRPSVITNHLSASPQWKIGHCKTITDHIFAWGSIFSTALAIYMVVWVVLVWEPLTLWHPLASSLAAAESAALVRELIPSVVTVTTLRCLAGSCESTSDFNRLNIRHSSNNNFNSAKLEEPE